MSTRPVPVNAVALLVGRVFSAVVALAVASVAAHELSLGDFGLMASVMAGGFLTNTLVTFGTDTVVTRAVAANRPDAGAVGLASLQLQLAAAVGLTAVAATAVALGVDAAVLVQALALLPLAVVTVAGAVLRGRQRMDLLLVSTATGAFCTLGAVLILFTLQQAAWVPIAATAVGSTVTALMAFWFARADLTGGERAPILMLLRETAPFAAMVILAAVGAQAGLLLVEFFTDETAGGYGIAVRLSEAARLVPAAAMGAFFPAMLSGLHRTDRYRRWLKGLIVYALVATAALLVLAAPINRIVFDTQPGGETLIRILSLGLVLTVVRLTLSFELIADGNEHAVLHSAVLGAAITVIGGALVAGRFGAAGVAWMQLFGLGAAVGLLTVRRSVPSQATSPTLI